MPAPPLYAQPKSSVDGGALGAKRDPPSFLAGANRRNVPATLANKNLNNQTHSLNSDKLLVNSLRQHDPTKVRQPPAALNISNVTSGNAKREPPASIGGAAGGGVSATNKSMDLSMIMAQINQSPAPKPMRRKPGGGNAVNYLAKRDGKKNECIIF